MCIEFQFQSGRGYWHYRWAREKPFQVQSCGSTDCAVSAIGP
jgi:hypothetical protein